MFDFSNQPKNSLAHSSTVSTENEQTAILPVDGETQTGLLAGVAVPLTNSRPAQEQVSSGAEAEPSRGADASAPSLSLPTLNQVFSNNPTQPESFQDEHVEAFKNNFKVLLDNINQPSVIGQVIRRIMVDLNLHPEYREFMAPEDCGIMVRACRENYGVAVQTKKSKQRGKKKQVAIDVQGGIADLNKTLSKVVL